MNKLPHKIRLYKIDEQLSKLFKLFEHLVTYSVITKDKKMQIGRFARSYRLWMKRMHYHKGWLYTVELNKFGRLCFQRRLAGQSSPSQDLWCRMGRKNKLPLFLREVPDIIGHDNDVYHITIIRLIQTLLFIPRHVESDVGKVDWTTITNPGSLQIPGGFLQFLEENYSGILDIDSLEPVEPHNTTSMGPNGPALPTSLDDLKLLPEDLKKSLLILSNDCHG